MRLKKSVNPYLMSAKRSNFAVMQAKGMPTDKNKRYIYQIQYERD